MVREIPQLIIDIREPMQRYRTSAPSILVNFVDFKDFVSILVNTESAPYYDDVVMEGIITILQSKICHLEEMGILTSDVLTDIETYIQTYVAYLDCFLFNIIRDICREHEYVQYIISGWVDNTSPIIIIRRFP